MTAGAEGNASAEDGPRRYLIAAAVSRYPKCPAWDRPELVEAQGQVVRLFTDSVGADYSSALVRRHVRTRAGLRRGGRVFGCRGG
jgi:hypothetical protein